MRTALIATAVTSTVVAVRRRRRPAPPTGVVLPALPAQRTSTPCFLDDDADLSVAEQQAQDERVLAALDRF